MRDACIDVFPAGCSPPSPPVNGKITEHSSGTVGAKLIFQCDTGYMPQEGNMSTCVSLLHSAAWTPTPECKGIVTSRNITIATYSHQLSQSDRVPCSCHW